jgi:hypothetical protein
MNFDNMPELHFSFSYPAILIIMALIAGGMCLYFKTWWVARVTPAAGAVALRLAQAGRFYIRITSVHGWYNPYN